jgi:hypothetical protein
MPTSLAYVLDKSALRVDESTLYGLMMTLPITLLV